MDLSHERSLVFVLIYNYKGLRKRKTFQTFQLLKKKHNTFRLSLYPDTYDLVTCTNRRFETWFIGSTETTFQKKKRLCVPYC